MRGEPRTACASQPEYRRKERRGAVRDGLGIAIRVVGALLAVRAEALALLRPMPRPSGQNA